MAHKNTKYPLAIPQSMRANIDYDFLENLIKMSDSEDTTCDYGSSDEESPYGSECEEAPEEYAGEAELTDAEADALLAQMMNRGAYPSPLEAVAYNAAIRRFSGRSNNRHAEEDCSSQGSEDEPGEH